MLAASQGINVVGWAIFIGVFGALYLISLSFSAFVLKLACQTAGAEVPDTGQAMVISFLESLVGGMAYFSAVISVGFLGKAINVQQATLAATAGFSLIALTFVVPAGLYVPMLRVSFTRGLVIAVLRYVITLTILVLFAYAIMAFKGSSR